MTLLLRGDLRAKPRDALERIARNRDQGHAARTPALGALVVEHGVRSLCAQLVRDEDDNQYVRLHAALGLAFLGVRDDVAVDVCQRAMTAGFAMSASCFEVGWSALALALVDPPAAARAIAAVRSFANTHGDLELARACLPPGAARAT